MKKAFSIFFVLVANVVLMAHVVVPHHHHAGFLHHNCEVMQELGLDFGHNGGSCPADEDGNGTQENCIIAEADLFLARDYKQFSSNLLQVLYALPASLVFVENTTGSVPVAYKPLEANLPLKTILLPSGLRAPPVC